MFRKPLMVWTLALTAGLTWNTSSLLTIGILKVDLAGDYNFDGKVDSADYVVWRKTGINGQQGYLDWQANFGAISVYGRGSNMANSNAVPEPTSALVLILGVTAGKLFASSRRPPVQSRTEARSRQ